MSFSGGIQFGLLAEGLFELLGPILIFGIYIIASIAKAASKKGQSDDSGEETESELKKAVRRRYQEIYQRQVGKTPQKPAQTKRSSQYVTQSRPVQKTPPMRHTQRSHWEIQQEAIRQRNEKLQSQKTVPKRPEVNAPKQIPAAMSKAKQKQIVHIKIPKTVGDSRKQSENLLQQRIKTPESLRLAIILKEILDKPIALRDG